MVTLPADPLALLALVARRHPDLGARAAAPLGAGDFHAAWVVDEAWVVRVARHAEAAASLARERCLLPRLAPHLPLRIPEPVAAVAAEGADPAFAVHALLPGPTLTQERYLALDAPARDRAAGAVGGFLAALHAVDPAWAAACGVPTLDHRARAAALLHAARTGLCRALPPAGAATVERALAAYLDDPAAGDYRPVLLHGDLSPDHVLGDARTGAVHGVIDFGDAALGDPAWDLVYLAEDYGEDFLHRALPAAHPGEDHAPLLARMRHLLRVDAVAWAVGSHAEGDADEVGEAVAYLGSLGA